MRGNFIQRAFLLFLFVSSLHFILFFKKFYDLVWTGNNEIKAIFYRLHWSGFTTNITIHKNWHKDFFLFVSRAMECKGNGWAAAANNYEAFSMVLWNAVNSEHLFRSPAYTPWRSALPLADPTICPSLQGLWIRLLLRLCLMTLWNKEAPLLFSSWPLFAVPSFYLSKYISSNFFSFSTSLVITADTGC